MKVDLLKVLRTTVALEQNEEIAWKGGERTTIMIHTVVIEQFDDPASPQWRNIRSIAVAGYRKESGWRATPKAHTFYGGTAPKELHALINQVIQFLGP